jgi:hypothetical protein
MQSGCPHGHYLDRERYWESTAGIGALTELWSTKKGHGGEIAEASNRSLAVVNKTFREGRA